MKSNNFLMKDLDAIAVTNGPGSYTGLRVGMSAAKGLCYALQIPMITESTLRFMAYAAANQLNNIHDALLCPMIDARRMEVFAALYNSSLHELMEPTAIILDERSFSSTLQSHKTSFFGSGSMKWKKVTDSKNALFPEITCDVGYLGKLSYKKFINSQFTDIIYSQPVYIKEFQSHIKK
jgi:tRNA threonylcarbamoyladenosine biosynthesis protein TsaB